MEEKVRAMPGITVYVVKPEDSLWDIAKKFLYYSGGDQYSQ